ncbi:MAG: carboxypeptidase-like regulatory domain-containing protein [Cyclobacteriaceae bacterium]|nr:carboxypeptidase-like regulatory domain-containing protein [Cyclobacteriaceae bacterium]
MRLIYFLVVLICNISVAWCQTGDISGKILDGQTLEPLPFAHVFVNNTTRGITSDADGNFNLKNVPVGAHELIFSYVGYQTFQSKVNVTPGQAATITVRLMQTLQELAEVEVKATRDKEWLKQLRTFEKIFLGEPFTSTCKIKNPWVLDFASGNSKVFITKASAPIEITNNYLGYTVLFHLKHFQSGSQGYSIDGHAYFKELNDPAKTELWAANRAQVYSASDRHLFKSILSNQATQQGYRLYIDKPGAVDVNTRSDRFYSEVGKKIVAYSTKNIATPTSQPYEYIILLNGRTEVHYLNKPGTVKYYKDMPGAVSWIEARGNQVRVNNNGVVLNTSDVIYSGELSNYRVGNLLPLDYQPDQLLKSGLSVTNPPSLTEKVYIHTDKPYYYPGETIWMKAYLNYSQPGLRDSLSKVLYIELIHASKEINQQKIVKIDDGWAAADFVLPATLPAGNYMIRAYTNWMRNFGEPCFSLKPVPVLNLNEKLERDIYPVAVTDSSLSIVTGRESYKPREKIELTIYVQDENKLPALANLSVSITDEKQVAPLKEEETIITGLTLPRLPKPAVFAYPVEQGIVLAGIFKNDKQKPERTNLMVVVGKVADFFMVDTDTKGKFILNGLQFYDSLEFAFQAKDKRGKPYGSILLDVREVPPISTIRTYKRLSISDSQLPQRMGTQFEMDKDATLLEEVTVEANRVEPIPTEVQHKIFGKPDHVVKGETLVNSGASNLAVALQGKVPGMIITPTVGARGTTYKIFIRGVSSVLLSKEPLVLIDGVPVGGSSEATTKRDENGNITELGELGDTAGDRLNIIDPNMIDRIEVTTRVNSLYGDAGRNGVIAIFTKAGATKRSHLIDLKTVDVHKVSGYSSPHEFKSPDFSNLTTNKEKPDYRSTIYWNPNLKTDDTSGTCSVSCFAADLPGRYRVVVEGITQSGKPIRAESVILIQNE